MTRPRRMPALAGAYVQLADLLALRHRPWQPAAVAASRDHRAGARLSKLRGRGIDFAEVRLYQPGDDVRSIDWRVTARKNKPHTKVFREERERPALVVVDQTQSMFFGSRKRLKSVAAAEFAALAAWQALASGDRVGGMVIGNDRTSAHRPQRSQRTVARLLADLAERNQALARGAKPSSEAHFRDGLQRIRRLAHTNSRILLISDFLTAPEAWRETLSLLARHNQVTAVRVWDLLERELPAANRYTLADDAGRWQFHAGNRSLRRRYRERHERREAELAALCAAHLVRYLPVATDDSPSALEAQL